MASFHLLTTAARQQLLADCGTLSPQGLWLLQNRSEVLPLQIADRISENVIGVLGLPLGIGQHLLVNNQPYCVPMAIEEPSVVAALSSAAKRVKQCGGFTVEVAPPKLIGQIFITALPDLAQAIAKIQAITPQLLDFANRSQARMVARGGGVQSLHPRQLNLKGGQNQVLVVDIVVDSDQAMGANMVNSVCELLGPELVGHLGGRVVLQILSNYTTQALVHAHCVLSPDVLADRHHSGQQVCDDIVFANSLAANDLYRAVTHNKGIMNGIDPIAVATGNDWRAIEAAAHAFAARSGVYQPLTNWQVDAQGRLVGDLNLPLKVGVVGANIPINPAVQVAHQLLGKPSASQLAAVMAAAGLAQNLAALRALVTDGIQKGHMRMHARSVVQSANVPEGCFDEVVTALIASQDIKVWRAQRILADLTLPAAETVKNSGTPGFGKVILLGEHAVVYGSHALALPLSLSVRSHIVVAANAIGVRLSIWPWGIDGTLEQHLPPSLTQSLQFILAQLGLANESMHIHVTSTVPRAMGLGASAALAVSVIRALVQHFALASTEAQICALAFAVEKLAHGTPSGVDNTVATYGKPLLFCKNTQVNFTAVQLSAPLYLVIGLSHTTSFTHAMVKSVGERYVRYPIEYDRIFQHIDALVLAGQEALEQGDITRVGTLLNINHGLLNSLGIVTLELSQMVDLSRRAGALGAKITGSGGGGAMVALCNNLSQQKIIHQALQQAGFTAIPTIVAAS